MRFVRTALVSVGAIGVLLGVIWMGQGSGYFPYPAASFMIDQSVWILRGAILAAVCAVVALVSLRIRP